MRRTMIILCALLLTAFPFTAYASDGGGVLITVVIPQSEPKKETPVPIPPKKYLYPVSTYESQNNGRREIIKTYELSAKEKPEDISRESFTRDGWLYELADITRKETSNTDARDHTESISIDTATNDTAAILKLLAPTMDYQSNDGYTGVLQLDVSSIKVEIAGTKSSSYAVSATREYPHLSSNDTSLIPKTITDGGRTLALSNVNWKTQNYTAIDYDQIPDSYTAVATYTGTASRTTVTGYVTTANYRGKVSKITKGKTVYTAYFVGIPIVVQTADEPKTTQETTEQPTEPVTEPIIELELTVITEPPAETESTTESEISSETEPEKESEQNNILSILAGIGVGLALFIICIYFCLNKKKKEVIIPNEDEETD